MALGILIFKNTKAFYLSFTLSIISPMLQAEVNHTLQENRHQEQTSQPCTCKFMSKHYNWNNSSVPAAEQVPLFQFQQKLVWNWSSNFYQTSSRFRCLYECVDSSGYKEIVEYVHSETQPGYFDGGVTAAKKFNCSHSSPRLNRKYDYYETHESTNFIPLHSSIEEIQRWAKYKSCDP